MIIKAPIDLKLTQESGQTSQPPWKTVGDTFQDLILIDNEPVIFKANQIGNNLNFEFDGNISEKQANDKIREIYDLDFNLNKFYKYLDNHDELKDMSKFCNGLRLFLAKDKFECLMSSICSANNSIARWTKSITDIKQKWGDNYNNFYTFPRKLASEDDLKECGVGYRAPYMKKSESSFNPTEICKMDYEEAFDEIIKLPGVGPKVADCILLYGFNFKEAFPSDVWIKRIVSYLYFDSEDIKVEKVREFGMEEFGDYAGYVQLYMFHYARKSGLMEKLR